MDTAQQLNPPLTKHPPLVDCFNYTSRRHRHNTTHQRPSGLVGNDRRRVKQTRHLDEQGSWYMDVFTTYFFLRDWDGNSWWCILRRTLVIFINGRKIVFWSLARIQSSHIVSSLACQQSLHKCLIIIALKKSLSSICDGTHMVRQYTVKHAR